MATNEKEIVNGIEVDVDKAQRENNSDENSMLMTEACRRCRNVFYESIEVPATGEGCESLLQGKSVGAC